jgi:hypothetical protein
MTHFDVFDAIKLKEEILSTDGETIAAGTVGTIVDLLDDGAAYLVELFGDWIKYDENEELVLADATVPDAFRETLGVEVIYPQQMRLVKPASETVGIRAQLLTLMDELSEDVLVEVKDFAEFLKYKKETLKQAS